MPLARFSRLVAEATTPAEIFPSLLTTAIEETRAIGAAILEVDEGGNARVAAHENVPEALVRWTGDVDDLADAAKKLDLHAAVRPLISDHGLFGALVLLFADDASFPPEKATLIDALVDLSAVVLAKNARLAHLQRLHDELRATQRALAQAEKLRALGEMAAGVAHDLKNVLNPLSMHLQMLERAHKSNKHDTIGEEIADMKEALRRGVRTIDRLRDYGRSASEAPPGMFELRPVVEEAVSIAKPRLASSKARIPRLVIEVEGSPRVMGHRDEVVSAVVNLVINAIDALCERDGTIVVSANEGPDGSVVQVRDNGPGMPPEVERRVFEPFFTTKGEAGTGLGLAMVYACMRRHAGSVELVTGENAGTTFTLRFPRPVD